ncbi:hypothetical protein DHEL01_v210913 [Diaporthe helianthi]|uniref:Uncharacterized protein n=1 Tax=Diaporthe helianthi TaxID=158607 RepID=A0A2P5HKA4_DIAHE|nr:hypothetical protein DHEL01_v210913 [Diaporthe helianthi]
MPWTVLDGILPDACAACLSDPYFPSGAGTWEHLRKYKESPDTVPSALATDIISLAVAQKMAEFHLRVVEPLTERYCRWVLSALSSSPEPAPLTKTEKSRIQRAIYRLQVICNSGISGPQEILAVLDSFGPWAAEQIICVYEFAKERFTSAFIECAREFIKQDLDPPIYHYVPQMMLDFNERLLLYQEDEEYIDGETLCEILSLGLSVLQESFRAKDVEDLCDVIRSNLPYCVGGPFHFQWIHGAVRQEHQFDRYFDHFYSEHDEPQDTRQEMLFEQDDLLSPPLAWVTFWGGRYSNQIGEHIPAALHRWGYVMWDAKRLKESGAMEYIELEWQCKYGIRGSSEDDDPRDYYIAAYQQELGNDASG